MELNLIQKWQPNTRPRCWQGFWIWNNNANMFVDSELLIPWLHSKHAWAMTSNPSLNQDAPISCPTRTQYENVSTNNKSKNETLFFGFDVFVESCLCEGSHVTCIRILKILGPEYCCPKNPKQTLNTWIFQVAQIYKSKWLIFVRLHIDLEQQNTHCLEKNNIHVNESARKMINTSHTLGTI